MKIGVYAPSKNESNQVQAWYESCKDADVICVADTGSTDNTIELLTSLGVMVTSIRIIPFRFDDAFNFAQSLLPDDVDICIRLDLDERLDTGWRTALEEAWVPGTTQLRYPYIWNWLSDGVPGLQWHSDRIHSRSGWRWRGATHEGLCCRTICVQAWTDKVKILQYPIAKDKSIDLPLLREAVAESPHDARMVVYLAREYMYAGDFTNSTITYKDYLTMPGSGSAERCQAMTNLSKTDPDNKVYWLKCACLESPYHREPLVELAKHYHDNANWPECWRYSLLALKITDKPGDYTCTAEAWGAQPHDLAGISAWNLKLYRESLEHCGLALAISPTDSRLQSNWLLVKDFFDKNLQEPSVPGI